MRNISFMLTTPQFLDRSKTVTRRVGWRFLKVGHELCGVEKSQGLGKGGKIKRLGIIRVTGSSFEPLRFIGEFEPRRELVAEGFPQMTADEFIEMFCKANKLCTPETIVHRIQFEYL